MWLSFVATPLWWLLGFPFWFGLAPAFVFAHPMLGVLVTYAIVLVGMALLTRRALDV
jgi:hypothetical protein